MTTLSSVPGSLGANELEKAKLEPAFKIFERLGEAGNDNDVDGGGRDCEGFSKMEQSFLTLPLKEFPADTVEA